MDFTKYIMDGSSRAKDYYQSQQRMESFLENAVHHLQICIEILEESISKQESNLNTPQFCSDCVEFKPLSQILSVGGCR